MSSCFNGDWHTRQLGWTVATLALLACGAAHAQSVDTQPFTDGGAAGRTALGGTPLRIGHRTEGFGQEASETAMGGRGAIDLGGAVGFADGQFRISNESRFGSNVGLGMRWFADDFITGSPRILGVSGWYDGQETVLNNYFNQGGVSFESLGEFIDLRLNANIPFEDQKLSEETFLSSELTFAGNSIAQTTLTPADVTLRVVDFEAAARVLDLNLWAYGGGYQMDGNGVSETGAKVGFRGYLTNDLLLDVGVTDDEVFHTNTVVQVVWTPGRTGAGPTSWIHTLADRMREPVYRNTYIATQQVLIEDEVALTDEAGEAFNIVHVDSDAAPGGNGTFEAPFDELTDVEPNTDDGDVILVHANSVFNGQSVALQDVQKFFGEGNNVELRLTTRELGDILLPETFLGARGQASPIIANAPGAAAILVVNDTLEPIPDVNQIQNFQIDGGTRGIFTTTGVGGIVISDMTINDTTSQGIELTPKVYTPGGQQFVVGIERATFDGVGGDDIRLTSMTPASFPELQNESISITDVTSTDGSGVGINLINPQRGPASSLPNTITNFNWDGGTTGQGALRIENSEADFNLTMNGSNTITGGETGTPNATGFAIALVDNAGDLTVTGTTVTDMGGDSVIVNGGAGDLNFTGRIVQTANAASILDVNAGTAAHTGALRFTELTANAGVIRATTGDGLQFNNADGVYTFNDEVEINGTGTNTATMAVNVENGSAAVLTFVNADFADTDDTTIHIDGGTAAMTLTGRIVQNNNETVLLVEGGHDNGALTFNELTAGAGVIEANLGDGLIFNNADAAYTFNDLVDLSGGNARIQVLNNSEGTFNFADGNIESPGAGNAAVEIANSNVIFTYTGDIDSNAIDAVRLDANSGGSVTFNSTIDSAQGILIEDNTAGTFLFADAVTLTGAGPGLRILRNSGANVTFSDAVNSALTLTIEDNTAGAFAFTGPVSLTGTTDGVNIVDNTGGTTSFNNIDITKTLAGRGFRAVSTTPGHTVTVTGTGNTISTQTGVAIELDTIAAGGAGINFQSVSSNGAASGIIIDTVTGGPVNIGTAGSAMGSSGMIAGSTGAAGVIITNAATVNVNGLTVDGNLVGGDGILITHSNATQSVVRINNARITETVGSGIEYNRSASATSRFTLTGSEIDLNGDTSVLMAINGTGIQDITINQGNMITNAAGDSAVDITTGGGAKTTNILIDSNTFFNTAAAPTVNVVSGSAGTMNTTVTSNSFTNGGAGTGYAQTSNVGTVRLDLNGNTATAGAAQEYILTEAGASTFTVVDLADVDSRNAGDSADPVFTSPGITDEPNPVPTPTP